MTSSDDNAAAIEADIDLRVAAVQSFYLASTLSNEILAEIDSLRKRGFRSDGSAMCMQISGPTGTGKSTLFQRYLAREDARRTDDRVPVLCFTMPSPYNQGSFLAAILLSYGAEAFERSKDIVQLRDRATKLMTRKGTELILVNDFQHLVDQQERTAKISYLAADQIKLLLLDGVKIPTVFNGLGISDEIYIRNPQLLMRRHYYRSIAPFSWKVPVERERFMIMVQLLAKRAGFDNYDDLVMGLYERIWRATEGNPGILNKLFQVAAALGGRRDTRFLTADILAEAHARNAAPEPGWKNVFTVDVLPSMDKVPVPDESRVTKLTKQIARVNRLKGTK